MKLFWFSRATFFVEFPRTRGRWKSWLTASRRIGKLGDMLRGETLRVISLAFLGGVSQGEIGLDSTDAMQKEEKNREDKRRFKSREELKCASITVPRHPSAKLRWVGPFIKDYILAKLWRYTRLCWTDFIEINRDHWKFEWRLKIGYLTGER